MQEVFIAANQHISRNRWEKNWRIAFFILLFEFIQTALFLIDDVFGWSIDWDRCAVPVSIGAP